MKTHAAVSIAGWDPSGGAGMAADLRAFARAGVWGASACAALTVQSTRGVRLVRPVSAALLKEQVEELFLDLDVRAIKTGALGSAANMRVVVAMAGRHSSVPFVVDPVRLPTRTSREAAALDGGSPRALWLSLAHAATLVTPNLIEAAALLGVRSIGGHEAAGAAEALVEGGCRAVLVKGGHAKGPRAVDWLATARGVRPVDGPRRRLGEVHGTGCYLASLIAGRLAKKRRGAVPDAELFDAVAWARAELDAAMLSSFAVGGGSRVLGPRPR